LWSCLLLLFVTFVVAYPGPASAQKACPSDLLQGSASQQTPEIETLLASIPGDITWADLPVSTKAQLQKLADDRLAAFRANWSAAALARKQQILLDCPTPQMVGAIDDYYRKTYSTILPPSFLMGDVKNSELARALVRNYLSTYAAFRATLYYPTGIVSKFDWDGRSLFDSIRLPDKDTYEAIKQFALSVVADLRAIDAAALDPLEKSLQARALFDARAQAVGAFSGDSYGGSDMQTACELIRWDYDILGGYERDKGRPEIFATDEDVLREANAIYLNNIALRWLDIGTFASATHYCNFTNSAFVQDKVGDPAKSLVAKGLILLKKWWIERIGGTAEQNKCSPYTDRDRRNIWEAFSADQQFNNDGSSTMDVFKARLPQYRATKLTQYRDRARSALRLVFQDDSILTAGQRQQLLAAFDTDTAFGLFISRIATNLDVVQGTSKGPAATIWNKSLADNVRYIGGEYGPNDAVRVQDESDMKAMFAEVKAWVASHYRGYPIDIASLFPHIQLKVTTANNANTIVPGNISIGVGTPRSKYEHYSTLIHELRHAIAFAWQANAPDKSKIKFDEGPAVEGSGVAVEALLLQPFANDTLKDDIALALYALAYGIRDARFAGTTDATLQVYYRAGCTGAGESDTIEFTRQIAIGYGLTDRFADNVAIRSHAGSQYLQYVYGELEMLDIIAYLQSQIDPTGSQRVDPFVLFACGLNTPRRDTEYVSALRTCMKR
jgi:hypothetical protein